MKLSTTVVAYILLSVVYSQTIQSEVDMFPSCALTCLTNAISAAGCSITDYACQCGTRRSTIAGIATPCVVSTCSTTDAISKSCQSTPLPKANNCKTPKRSAKKSVSSKPLKIRHHLLVLLQQPLLHQLVPYRSRRPQQTAQWSPQ
jgi:hypothetical protein